MDSLERKVRIGRVVNEKVNTVGSLERIVRIPRWSMRVDSLERKVRVARAVSERVTIINSV